MVTAVAGPGPTVKRVAQRDGGLVVAPHPKEHCLVCRLTSWGDAQITRAHSTMNADPHLDPPPVGK